MPVRDPARPQPASVDTNDLWPGVWKASTNGLRVDLYASHSMPPREVGLFITIGALSNFSGVRFAAPPNGCFAKCEVRDTKGNLIRPRRGVKLEGDLPRTISVSELPRWPDGARQWLDLWGPGLPERLGCFDLGRCFELDAAGVYTVTVCPVVYQLDPNQKNLHRVDLPSLTTNVYLVPPAPAAEGFDGPMVGLLSSAAVVLVGGLLWWSKRRPQPVCHPQ